MRAGTLIERVTVQKRAAPGGIYRKEGEAWSNVVAYARARIAPIMGGAVSGETVIAQRLAGVSAYRVTLRDEAALAALDTGWRILRLDDGSPPATREILDVRHAARPPDARGTLVLTCVSERVSASVAADEGD